MTDVANILLPFFSRWSRLSFAAQLVHSIGTLCRPRKHNDMKLTYVPDAVATGCEMLWRRYVIYKKQTSDCRNERGAHRAAERANTSVRVLRRGLEHVG